jgi:hypothetical protein
MQHLSRELNQPAREGSFSFWQAMMDIKKDTNVVLAPTDRLYLFGNLSWQ